MLATTISSETTTTQTLRVVEASTPKTAAVEKIDASQQNNKAIAQNTVTETESSSEKESDAASAETATAAVKVMVQPAQQWRNCSKPHRI